MSDDEVAMQSFEQVHGGVEVAHDRSEPLGTVR
jgi:hypothetical protein